MTPQIRTIEAQIHDLEDRAMLAAIDRYQAWLRDNVKRFRGPSNRHRPVYERFLTEEVEKRRPQIERLQRKIERIKASQTRKSAA